MARVDVKKIAAQQIREPSPGTVLRHALDAQGISVQQAANLLKMKQPNVSQILADERLVGFEMAKRIEKAFGVPAYVMARLTFERKFSDALDDPISE